MKSNRKVATGLYLINWSRFANVKIRIEGSSLITGNNGTGKSTVLDAITYLLTGNTHFNIAAKDKDRSVVAYVKGDTRSEGDGRFLRGKDDVVSYLAMEFFSPVENSFMVVFVAIEFRKDDTKSSSYWYIAKDASFGDIVFCDEKDGKNKVFPKGEITVKGRRISNKEYMGMEKGTKQVLQALGLRCSVAQYRSKLIKMLAFDPQKNIDRFIQECVLEPGEMSSLADLKEQRNNYEEIRQSYDDMLESKKVLEHIEECTLEYEDRFEEYHKRRLLLQYQNWKSLVSHIADLILRKGQEEASLSHFEEQKNRKDRELEIARQKLEELSNSNEFKNITNVIDRCDERIGELANSVEAGEKNIRKLEQLQSWIGKILDRFQEELGCDNDDMQSLGTLSKEGNPIAKISAVYALSEEIKRLVDRKNTEKAERAFKSGKEKEALGELLVNKKQLEGNRLVFDRDFERTKSFIKAELGKRKIETEIKFFVELINDVKDKKWRRAIETFLGGKRFNIIVDPKLTAIVLQILNDNPALKGKVVIGDRLEETEIVPGSAAEQLEIINPTARSYANYLLNGIKLCESVEELHDNPRGALMANGMLAKSYAVGKMEINRTGLFIGQDAVKLQLEKVKKEIAETEGRIEKEKTEITRLDEEMSCLTEMTLRQDDYDFEAVNEVGRLRGELKEAQLEKERYKKDPGFMAILEESNRAREVCKRIDSERGQLSESIGGCKIEIAKLENEIEVDKEEASNAEADFERDCKEMPDLKAPVIDMYEQQIKKRNTVITPKTVKDWEANLESAKRTLEDAHLQYCRINGTDTQMRGVSFIGYYREQYRNLANVRIEEAKQRLEKQGERLQSAFVGDFVAEINEAISNAKEEIAKINRELKGRPFGNDIYQFEMKERFDSEGKALFFRICGQMHKYLDNPEYYLNSIKEDEESEQTIKDFIDIVLNEEDESEYTDYRKYFVYDMKIISRQGDDRIEAALSKKQGSASNGEKQTPYFIILAASLLQLYPKDRSSARLAFIDEAFSALSRERIEQMVDYLETNDFQVIYAAPPDKIGSIGSHIDTTVTLVSKGKQSFAVEGLIKNIETEY